ncbi:MAG: hypothetical protein ACRDRO_21585 [Pseudonocardiaceae bacterium]
MREHERYRSVPPWLRVTVGVALAALGVGAVMIVIDAPWTRLMTTAATVILTLWWLLRGRAPFPDDCEGPR